MGNSRASYISAPTSFWKRAARLAGLHGPGRRAERLLSVGTLNALAQLAPPRWTPAWPTAPSPRQRLDVYRPSVAAPAGGWPVVVFFYGGTWNGGNGAITCFPGPGAGVARGAGAGGGLPAVSGGAVSGFRRRQRWRWPMSSACGAARRQSAPGVRDGAQRGRIQRGDGGAGSALAGGHGACAAQAGGLDRAGGAVRLLSHGQPGGAAGVLPPELPARSQPIEFAHPAVPRSGAPGLPGRAGRTGW